ncbi:MULTISPECIES: hypothetical protein [Bradyrhizobium]|uniref:hypothetical protein n=1 Tax=Bradyrhizobium TaxID=374 RepID=UPI00115FF0BC|nr:MULTISPECIES: hypothetical protein [Bradyrhizobium]
MDLDVQHAWLRINAGNWNNDVSANPATVSNGIDFSSIPSTGAWHAFYGGNYPGVSSTANFGASAFAHAVPSGFSSWDALAVL